MALITAGSRYVAMGSSFGAGPGLTPRAPGPYHPNAAGMAAVAGLVLITLNGREAA